MTTIPTTPTTPTTPTSPTDATHQQDRAARPAGQDRYLRPDFGTRRVANPLIARLTRLGLSVAGSRVLEVPGRRTGRLQRTPVNVLELDGRRYLVSPRGTTQWVRNVRAAGGCTLLLGRRREAVRTAELPDLDKAAVLRAYLRRWRWEVGAFFDGVGPDATDEELIAIAAGYPVFRLTPAPA